MERRPKIHLELAVIDKLAEIAGWLTIIALWSFVLYNYTRLPENIPTHFNFSGQVDNYGSKSSLCILSIIGTFLYVGLTILNRFPHIFNFPVKITEDNALRQYTNATRLIRFLKLAIGFIFLGIIGFISSIATGAKTNLGNWFIPVILGLMFLPLAFFIIKSIREN